MKYGCAYGSSFVNEDSERLVGLEEVSSVNSDLVLRGGKGTKLKLTLRELTSEV